MIQQETVIRQTNTYSNVLTRIVVFQVFYTYLGEPTSLVRKRSVAQRMRIHVHYDSETIPQLKPELRNLIQV